eukprot:TRINITY_DN27400_c0_g1_i1.p1 TRINITY_DN27400_c0_g1~~TRINITY_DN27400_c0_g1_i1.p1  ORF type:complete len:404 (-),score=48.83 TRINITY_DN27400_c0_g1_i1:226-1305(-)
MVMPDGKRAFQKRIDVHTTRTVQQLKQQLFSDFDGHIVACGDQKLLQLVQNGGKMQDHEKLADIGLKDGDLIRATLRLDPFEPVHFWQGEQSMTFKASQSIRKRMKFGANWSSSIKFWTIVRWMQDEIDCVNKRVVLAPEKKYYVTVLAFNSDYKGKRRDCEQYKHDVATASGRSSFQYWESYFDPINRTTRYQAAPVMEWSVGEWHPDWPGKIFGYVSSYVKSKEDDPSFTHTFDLTYIEVGKHYRRSGVSTSMLAHVNMALDKLKDDIGIDFAKTEATGIVGKQATSYWTHNLQAASTYEKLQQIDGLTLEDELNKYRNKDSFMEFYNLANKEKDEKELLEEKSYRTQVSSSHKEAS